MSKPTNTVNADISELNKFNELAHKWWDKNSEFKPLHEINPLRLAFIEQTTSLQGKKVLDVGCGGGILSESMAQRGATVTGIDLGEKTIKVAQLHCLETGLPIDYQQVSVEDLASVAPESFDIVTCLEMLEHVPDPMSVINACAKLVKPSGHVYFSTINRNAKAYLFAVVGAEYVLGLLPRGTHDYTKFIKPSELAGWTRTAGLSLKEQVGVSYQPITQTYSLTNDVSVNYIQHLIKE